jgi:dolichol kinase
MNYRLLSLASFGGANAVALGPKALLAASIALGVAGSFADLSVPTPTLTLPKRVCGVRVPPFHVDDNFVVPLFSALACTKIFDYMGFTDVVLSKFLFF